MRHLFSSEGFFCLQRLATVRSVLIFDFDGTLAPIVSQPADARISTQTMAYLKSLSRSWPVAIVTGRSVSDVRQKLGFTPDYLFGNHGAERYDRWETNHSNENLNPCRSFLSAHAGLLAVHNVNVEDKGVSLALHYRHSNNPSDTRAWLHDVLRGVSQDVLLLDGHMVVNIVWRYAPDKGDALATILQESGAENALVMGDDENDEAAFVKAPQHAVTVRIGSSAVRSRARFRLSGQYQVNTLLVALLNQRNVLGLVR